jgi:serine/threonine-protein kinase
VEGETVAQRIAARGPLAVPDSLALMRRIAEPLAEVHGRGVIHRDLKPDNVFLVPGDDSLGRVKLFDFGIATLAGEPAAAPSHGMVVGTPAYMAPEQCVGTGACDHRADLYALGCILFELLAGTSPYGFLPARSVLVAHVRGPVPDVAVHAEVPPSVARLVARLLAKSPDDRPRDAHHAIDLIDSILRPGRAHGAGAAAHASRPNTATPDQLSEPPAASSAWIRASAATGSPAAPAA